MLISERCGVAAQSFKKLFDIQYSAFNSCLRPVTTVDASLRNE